MEIKTQMFRTRNIHFTIAELCIAENFDCFCGHIEAMVGVVDTRERESEASEAKLH